MTITLLDDLFHPDRKEQQKSGGQNQQDSARENAKEKAQHWKEKGNTAFNDKQFSLAVQYYTKAIEYDPTDPIFYANRAMAHLKLGM